MAEDRLLALVTGASSGIGYHLARECANAGMDLLVAADDPAIDDAAQSLRGLGATVDTIVADLATPQGVERVHAALRGRAPDVLVANAGHGLGHGFLDQDFDAVRHVIDTNVTGTLDLLHRVGQTMRARRSGRILVTGSIAGFLPGSFAAVYNATKAFIDSFAIALRDELKGSGVSVTCLMPGATDTRFFARADMLDTRLGQAEKDDPAEVARVGFEALMKGEAEVIAGWKNKLQAAAAHVVPAETLAGRHRKQAEPGSAQGY